MMSADVVVIEGGRGGKEKEKKERKRSPSCYYY